MGFKDKMQAYYTKSFMDKNGDRITQIQGNVISVKVEEKTVLWIFHKLIATLIVKPDRSKSVVKCEYKKNRWFKKPTFMSLSQGNLVVVQGLKGIKGKGNSEIIEIMNIGNYSTGKYLVEVEGAPPLKASKQVRKFK